MIQQQRQHLHLDRPINNYSNTREIHPNKNENINMQIFEKSLKEKQQDFNNLMNKEKPKEIDFSDKHAKYQYHKVIMIII